MVAFATLIAELAVRAIALVIVREDVTFKVPPFSVKAPFIKLAAVEMFTVPSEMVKALPMEVLPNVEAKFNVPVPFFVRPCAPENVPLNVRVVASAILMKELAESVAAVSRLIVAVVANVPPLRVKVPLVKLLASEIFKVPAETVKALSDSLLLALSVKAPAPTFSSV